MTIALERPSFYLSRMDIFNWGAFDGYHSVEIHPQGTAIIGPTGSGKTTLIDALMTLLTKNPKYNLASTGGHESDRNLMSYIRGVSGEGNDLDENHKLRKGKTLTGIGANFSNGKDTIQIACIFWINSSSDSANDRNDMWIISERSDQSLRDWLDIHSKDGVRALKQHEQETPHLRFFNVKKRYLADLRQLFEVGENAFTLLNRTSGLKQINSVNEVFREFVLEDHSSFGRAEEVVKEFENLEAIYSELERAKKQQELLTPIQTYFNKYKKVGKELASKKELQEIIPIWFALEGERLWGENVRILEASSETSRGHIDELEQNKNSWQAKAKTLQELYLQSGGGDIDQLKSHIKTQKELLQKKQQNSEDYKKISDTLGIKQGTSLSEFEHNRKWATKKKKELIEEMEQKKIQGFEIESKKSQYQENLRTIKEEITKIKSRPSSNLPASFQDFRTELAKELGTTDKDLPFIAELIQVKPEESSWRGAVERAIGGHRLRIIVPVDYLKNALHWVNSRDNRLHIRLLEGGEVKEETEFFQDGFSKKLNFKSHPLGGCLKKLLAQIDRHCVKTPGELKSTPHGMTRQGLMSGRKGVFEKQDKQPLNKNWMTGFDNRDRLSGLQDDCNEAEKNFSEYEKKYKESLREIMKRDGEIKLLETLLKLKFDEIDTSSDKQKLNDLEDKLQRLTAPESDLSKINAQYKKANEKLDNIEQKITSEREHLAVIKHRLNSSRKKQREALARAGEERLTDEQKELARKHIPEIKIGQIDEIDDLERRAREKTHQSYTRQSEHFNRIEKDIIRAMSAVKNNDPGNFIDIGTEIRDVPDYLEKLKVLNEEALPEKRKRFISYLNQSSDQGVVQLLANIENEVSIIEEGIEDLNKALAKVDYEPKRHIQLHPQKVKHPILVNIEKKQRHLRTQALTDDDGESHFKALKSIIKIIQDATESKRTLDAKALLDPRYRLQFSITKIDNESKEIIERKSGSKSGSGGEKEIIASYILVASLSYTLCSQNNNCPLFSTIVLDEAFSKTSPVRASRIVSAINEFQLQPLFITPNKELRLLRNHTRMAIVVHRKNSYATLMAFTWKQLDQYYKNKHKRK